MRVIDPGHKYLLTYLDAGYKLEGSLTFVKRIGDKYPGNTNAYPGTIMQEVLRALIDRAKFVHNQEPNIETQIAIDYMKSAVVLFEQRAANKRGRELTLSVDEIINGLVCQTCLHVDCKEHTA